MARGWRWADGARRCGVAVPRAAHREATAIGPWASISSFSRPGAALASTEASLALRVSNVPAPQVLAVNFDQVEGVEEHAGVVAAVADAVEARTPPGGAERGSWTGCKYTGLVRALPNGRRGQQAVTNADRRDANSAIWRRQFNRASR